MKEPGYGMLNVAIDDLLPNMNNQSQYEIRMYFYGNMKRNKSEFVLPFASVVNPIFQNPSNIEKY